MAESKSAAKTAKIMDVAQPGKTPPSASAKPIIVTNRPVIKQDPMMLTTDTSTLPEGRNPADLVSRVGKPVKIEPLHSDDVLTSVTPPSAPPVQAAVTLSVAPETGAQPITVKTNPVQAPAPKAMRLSIAPLEVSSKSTEEVPASSSDALPAPATKTAETTLSTPKPTGDPAPAVPSDAVAPAQSSSSLSSGSNVTAPSAEASADDDEPVEGDKQLAASKTLEDAKKKEEEQKASRQAELEKVIDSKQYYLPIHAAESQRGLQTALLLLVLVLLLALAWLDIVLDAGILKITGIHPLTHLFTH